MIVGKGKFRYEVVENWAKFPKEWKINNTCQIKQNSEGIFYVLNRSEHPIIMLDKEGKVLGAWGGGEFGWPHGLSITKDDNVWITDTLWHICKKFTPDGKLLMTLGTKGKPSDTGATSHPAAYWEVKRAAGPFNAPCDAVEALWGDVYVADGYRNVRVHVFSNDGKLKFSWGERGEGPGQFQSPHNIFIDEKERIYVAEMENLRVQIFTRDGKFIDQWTGIDRPAGMCRDKHGNFFITELGEHNVLWPRDFGRPMCKSPTLRILNSKGKTLALLGGPADKTLSEDELCVPGRFATPHGCWVDSDDNLYVTEPIATVIAQERKLRPDCHTVQKFIPVK